MAQEDEDKKAGGSEDSSGEMDIIKQAFGTEEPVAGETADVFSVDLFGGQQDQAGEQEAEQAPPQTDKPGQEQQAESPGVKIVTDDDLKHLFEKSSPGSGTPPAPPARAMASPPAGEQPASAAGDVGPVPEEVSEIGLDQAVADRPSRPAGEGIVDSRDEVTSELSDISPDEVVEQLETRARAGDMTAVGAAKKGEQLKRTEELISKLEPAGEDLMKVEELKKLFRNVDLLINWAKEMTERIERMEQKLDELAKR